MSDPWVENTQIWLNDTYTGVQGWDPVDVTGKTGWPTMYALTKALQHELGITALSNNFGPGTLAALSAIGNIGPSTTNKNIVRILQGGMYCKGYNGGDGFLNGDYSEQTEEGVLELKGDIGLSTSSSTVEPKLFKAILTMDAYVLLSGGSSDVRIIQRDLNGRYIHREDFFIIPADGLYSREVQVGLMLALQYEIGMADGVANGNFGPGTQDGLRNQANFGEGDSDATTGKYFIHLFQASLLFNNYPTPYNGVFSTGLSTITQFFQSFCLLATTGRSDYQTWASLLVSTGDVDRPGTAADTIRQITPARASTLVTSGYQTVGRYLTNVPVAGALNKKIQPGELEDIFAAGLSVFPIFQESGTDSTFFTYHWGYLDGQLAHDAASGYGFKPGTVIYFAVDYDALEAEVYSRILPYFTGVRDGLASRFSKYSVGVYGSRNTCSIVTENGLALFSFVSGMSTKFSGNLGFPLPINWAFDQILEYEIGIGDGWLNIDKNIQSGRDPGQTSIEVLPPPALNESEKALEYMYKVQATAWRYFTQMNNSMSVPNLIARHLREPWYTGTQWAALGGVTDQDFNVYADAAIPSTEWPLAFNNNPAVEVGGVDWPHMMAAISVYLHRNPSTSTVGPEFSDMGGWAGDQITLAADWYFDGKGTVSPYQFSIEALEGTRVSQFPPEDVHADIMAWVAAYSLSINRAHSLVHAIQLAYDGETYSGENTFDTFIRLRWGTTANGYEICKQVFEQPGDSTDRLLFNAARTWILESYDAGNPISISDFQDTELREIAKAVVNSIANLSTNFSPLP